MNTNTNPFQPLDVLHEESVGIEPWQEDVLQHIAHSLGLELEVLRSHRRRVHQVQSETADTWVITRH